MSRSRSKDRARGKNKPQATGAGAPDELKETSSSRGRPLTGTVESAASGDDNAASNADSKERDPIEGKVRSVSTSDEQPAGAAGASGTSQPGSGNPESPASETAAAGGSASDAPKAGADPSQTPKPEASKPVDNKPETPKTDSPKAGSDKSEPVKSSTGTTKTEPPKPAASAPAAAKPATGPGSNGGGRVPPTPPGAGGNGSGRSSKMPLIVGGVALVLALGIGMNAASNANKAQDMVNATNDRLSTALRELNQMQERTQALPDTISRLEREVRDELAQALEKARNDVAGIEQRQVRRLETLEEGLTALQDDSARPHREWQVAEVRYLMRIADHRLSLMDDAQGALAALNAADEMLKAIGDPRFGEVRDAIALEKQALESYDGTQVSQLVAELEQITAELKPMPLKMPEAENGAARLLMVNGEPAEDAAWWERAYFQVMNELNQHVTVRRHAQPVRSMPDADAELFMRQVLALRIESARLAALRLDAEDYRANLKGAQELLVEYFASEPVAPLLKRLQDLEQRELRAERPDISGSLEKLSGLEG